MVETSWMTSGVGDGRVTAARIGTGARSAMEMTTCTSSPQAPGLRAKNRGPAVAAKAVEPPGTA